MEKLIEIKNTVTLQGLDCANCASKIESKINDLPEIQGASVDFINASCTYITNDSNNDKVLDSIKKIVNELEPDVRVITEEVKEEEEEDFKGKKIQILAGVVLIIIGFIVRSYSDLFGSIFFVASYLLLGYEVIVKAVKNLLKGNLFDENFLMAIATIVAIFLQEYLEAAAVMVFYQFGELFQDQAVATSRSNIASLMDIRPDYANVIRNNEVETINPELVKINEVVVVKPGEKIPLDGVVIEGSSMLDTSSLTGESLAFEAEVGTNVISGCVNLDGILKVKVTKPYGESTVNKILELVENTSSRKANAEKFITKFSKVYTPVVVISAALLALLLPLFINIPYSESIRRAATFLIISCPCALVLSIPLGFYAGIGSLSKIGILVKGSTIVESLSKVKRVVLD
ncbi:MAG: heavy metal translocating P-type ATPase, partial [Erysipelotrichaceae bacterium]|nr:heavy metal translocating P-type ATPase [Erysipelotrichaceae bacterium]